VAVSHFYDGVSNPIRQHVAIFRITRFAAFRAITQEAALDQDRWMIGVPQDPEAGEMHSAIGGVRHGQKLRLDAVGQFA
jgi:hypothetical protein